APSQEKQKAKASSKRSASAAALAPEPQRDDDDDDEPVSSAKATKSNGRAKDQLISLGKSKGFLTYDDVHEALPGEDVGPDQMDDVLSALDDEEIEVVDDASNIKIAPHRVTDGDEPASKPAVKTEEEVVADGPASTAGRAAEDEYYKSNDPVRMYLRKMGSVALLTRE